MKHFDLTIIFRFVSNYIFRYFSKSFFPCVHGKNSYVERSKILAEYRSEN